VADMPTLTRDAESFDYIVIGAGAAGCLLANRLSADPACRVLLLEAGGRDNSILFRVPIGYRYTIGNPRTDWCFDGEPEPYMNGRVLRHPRGKVIGGSTAINGMVCIRGQAGDYDDWRDMGLAGWSWSDVLPYFKQHEDYFGGANDFHGTGGEWTVSQPRMWWDALDSVRQAAIESGIPAIDDFNAGDNEGVGPINVSQKNGLRWSTADAFLKPVLNRPNLKLEIDALVERVLFDSGRAVGVAWRRGGAACSARATREVVLSAGTMGTPTILMHSGVGPAAHLTELGIKPIVDRAGVGANFHDHLQFGMRYRLSGTKTLNNDINSLFGKAKMLLRYALTRTGPLTTCPGQLGIFTRSDPSVARPDLSYHVVAFSRSRPTIDAPFDPFPGLTMIVNDLRPTSRGEIRLKSPDPAMPPSIRANFLSTERDQRVAVNAVRITRRIMSQSALSPLQPMEQWPGPELRDDDEAGLLRAVAGRASVIFHPVGTAKMGLPSDPMTVVDTSLRVVGVERLRVIDASIMPSVVSGNTATPTVMIAEKGAAMLLAKH